MEGPLKKTFAKQGKISNKLLLWALDDINLNKQFLLNTFVYILKLHFCYLIFGFILSLNNLTH